MQNMKKNTKVLALILAAMMTLSSFASCSDKGTNGGNDSETTGGDAAATETTSSGEETTVETEEERIKPDIPATADYGGDDINFLFWQLSAWMGTVRQCRDIYSEGITGEAINDAVYNRNIKIEDAYKVKIALEMMDLDKISTAISQEVNGGTNTYDVMYPRLYDAPSLYQKAYFHNIKKIPNIDLEKPWWDSNSVEAITCSGYLPAVATSINVNDKDATAAVAFNKTIASNAQLEDIYSLVREGKWTYDKLSTLAEAAYQDLNGDGQMMPDDDLYGLLGGNDVMAAFFYGSGSSLVTHDETGAFALTFGTERDINAATKVVEMMNQKWFMNHHTIANTDDTYYRQLFESGHGLFFWMRLDDVTNMRAGEADFGIIPTPKYEESQDAYYSMVSQHTTGLLSVPITLTGDKLSEVGMVLEALAAESHYTLIPEYIETSLKTKNSRDAESADMLDIIINNRVFDPMLIYNFGGFADAFMDLGKNNNTDIASFIKGKQKLVDKMIKKTTEALEAADAEA